MNNNQTDNISSFMKEQLQFRADPEKMLKLAINPEFDSHETEVILPKNCLESIFLCSIGMYGYFMSRGVGAAHQIVLNRSFKFRMRSVGYGIMSVFGFSSAAIYNIYNYKPYKFTEY